MTPSVRERGHLATRSELAEAALDLLVQNGYETQTVEDLARALGISRATFFRYLGSKDEAVVAAVLGPAGLFADAFSADLEQAASGSVTVWRQLQAAFAPAVALADSAATRMRARLRLVQSVPALGARLRRARAPQIDQLAGAMVEHGHDPAAAAVLAAAAVAVLDQCWVQWQRAEDASLGDILDAAFDHLEAASRPRHR